jgi:hypothetical protein
MARHWRAAKEILRDEVSDEALEAASVARRASNSFAQILTASLVRRYNPQRGGITANIAKLSTY